MHLLWAVVPGQLQLDLVRVGLGAGGAVRDVDLFQLAELCVKREKEVGVSETIWGRAMSRGRSVCLSSLPIRPLTPPQAGTEDVARASQVFRFGGVQGGGVARKEG